MRNEENRELFLEYSHTLDNLNALCNYEFKIQCINEDGKSKFSDIKYISKKEEPTVDMKKNIKINDNKHKNLFTIS